MRRIAVPGLTALLAVALVALLVFGVLQTGDDTSIDQAVATGRYPVAHDASLPLLGGGTRSLADFRGKVVVVNFFAHWCDGCAHEAHLLARTQSAIASRGATFLGVAWDDTTSEAQTFVRQYGVDYPVVRDVDGSFATHYGVTGMPESFVVDRRGRIVALRRGELTPSWIAQHLDPLLSRRS